MSREFVKIDQSFCRADWSRVTWPLLTLFIRVNNSPKYGTKHTNRGEWEEIEWERGEEQNKNCLAAFISHSAQLSLESAVLCPDPESFKCKFKFNSETHCDVTWARGGFETNENQKIFASIIQFASLTSYAVCSQHPNLHLLDRGSIY